MKKTLLKFMIVVVAAGVMIGCRSAPVYNVEEQTIVSSSNSIKADDVKKAIIRAGAALGWQMKEGEPGHVIGTLFLREHMAQVDVSYSVKSYSVNYMNSRNLNYDGTNIHSNYNGWIQNLQRNIDAQLSVM